MLSANPDASTEDCFVVEYCLGLWLGCILHNDQLLDDLQALPFLDALTLKVHPSTRVMAHVLCVREHS
jgi:hypothetical protein